MMFARIFMIILMVGGVWCERCPECAEPARILRNECGVPTKTDLGGYFDCVWVEWDILICMSCASNTARLLIILRLIPTTAR